MKLIIKQIIVMIISFLVILWFQNNDDKNHNRKRLNSYDKYKLPLLVSAIIGFILNYPLLLKSNECNLVLPDITIISPIEEVSVPIPTQKTLKDIINNLQISTDMPDF